MALLFPALFEPYTMRGHVIPNRLVRSATGENMTSGEGVVDERYERVLARLARGGVGLIISGVTYVAPIGATCKTEAGIHHDGTVPALRKANEAVHGSSDAKVVCQLGHAGRQTMSAVVGDTPIAPSPVKEPFLGTEPREMTKQDVEETIDQFIQGAVRAKAADFDGIQLHAAHGYLINQFLTPKTNLRSDEWGGDTPEKRMRFLEEIYRGCRQATGEDFLIMVKLNCDDYVEGGIDLSQARLLVKRLGELGIDAIETSGGIYESVWRIFKGGIPFDMMTPDLDAQIGMKSSLVATQWDVSYTEGYHLPYTEALKPVAGSAAMMCVGGWKTPLLMEQAVAEGKTDFISMCRPLVRNPEWPNQIRAGAVVPSNCASCNRCLWHEAIGDPIKCWYNEGLRKASVPPA